MFGGSTPLSGTNKINGLRDVSPFFWAPRTSGAHPGPNGEPTGQHAGVTYQWKDFAELGTGLTIAFIEIADSRLRDVARISS